MGFRVLIVDDSPVLRIMLREMIESLGHEVVGEAEDGESAIKEFREKKPRTQKEYRYYGDKLREKFGSFSVRSFTRKVVLAFRDSMQDRPAGANQAVPGCGVGAHG